MLCVKHPDKRGRLAAQTISPLQRLLYGKRQLQWQLQYSTASHVYKGSSPTKRAKVPRYRKFQSGCQCLFIYPLFFLFRDDTRALDFTSLSPTSGRPFQANAATEKLEKNGNNGHNWSSWKDSATLLVEISYMSYTDAQPCLSLLYTVSLDVGLDSEWPFHFYFITPATSRSR